MITIKDFMTTVNYRITEGSDFGWQCFGSNAYCLDSWNGDHEGHTASITFDTHTQEVYLMEVCDYAAARAYRLINPNYKEVFFADVKSRGINDDAWDGVKFTDLETDEDMLAKTKAIVDGKDYDTRVSVPVDLEDSEWLVLFKQAHEADMSLNAYMEKVFRELLSDPEIVKKLKNEKENKREIS